MKTVIVLLIIILTSGCVYHPIPNYQEILKELEK